MNLPSLRLRGRPRRPAFLAALLLFAASFALFSPAVRFSFLHFDDHVFVAENPIVANGFSWRSVPLAFTQLHGDRLLYTPFLWLSYLADTLLFRASPVSPAGFHLSNVLLHAANAVLLFFVLRLCSRRTLPALLAAAFWAFHPLRVESVAWVTERKDTLSTLFAFLSVLFYLRAWGRGRTARSGDSEAPAPPSCRAPLATRRGADGFQRLSLAAFAAGLLSKPMLVTLPFLFLLLDYWPLRRFSLRGAPRSLLRLAIGKWPFFLLSAAASLLTRVLQAGAIDPVPLLRRLSWLPSNYLFYLAKSVWPSALSPMNPGFPVAPAFLAAASLVLLALAALAVAALRRCPGFAVGLAAFAGLLFPVSGIVVVGSFPVADRYSYLPSFGLALALLAILDSRGERGRAAPAGNPPPLPSPSLPGPPASPTPAAGRWRPPLVPWHWVLVAFLCAALAALAVATHRLLPAWRDDDALYARVARFFPRHVKVVEHQFTLAFFRDGDLPRAAALADRLSAALPRDAHAALARLRVLARTGPSRDAIDAFDAAPPSTSIDELRLPLYATLAVLAADAGLPDRALACLEAAFPPVPLAPSTAAQFRPVAVWVALAAGRPDLALSHLRATPGFADAETLSPDVLLKPAAAVWNLGLCPQALPSLLAIARDAPSNPALLNNVAWLLATTPASPADPADALSIASRALALLPSNPVLQDTLAAALAAAGRFDEAADLDASVAAALVGSPLPENAAFRENVLERVALYRRRLPFTEPSAALILAAP